MAENRRDVEFVIRARDLGSRTFKEVAGAVDEITVALEKQVAAASRGEGSAADLRTAYRQLEEAGRGLVKNQGLIDYHTKLADRLEVAESKALKARDAQRAHADEIAKAEKVTKGQETAQTRLNKAAETAEKRAQALRDTLVTQGERLKEAGIDTDNLAASQQRLMKTAEKVGTALVQTQGALDGYDANLRKAKAAQDQLANANSLAQFRKIGETAQENAKSLGAGTQAVQGFDEAADSLATKLRRIVDPASEAGENIDKLEAHIAALDAKVGIADQPIRDYQDAIYDLGQAQRTILAQAGSIDMFRNQEVEVKRAEQAFATARAEVLHYGQAVATADAPNTELARSLRQAEAALGAANRELDLQTTKLAGMRGNLKAAGIDTDKLAAAERRLKAASTTTAAALTRLDSAAAGKNTKAGRFLGLRPYELQNLSFQINDIFTQIASGTSVTQTLAQQGGQIYQLFPRAFAGMAAFLPELIAVGAVLFTIGSAIKHVLDESARLRDFEGDLALTADSAAFTAQELSDATHALDVFGDSADDAKAAVKAFVDEGLNPEMLDRFGVAAQNLADVTGKSLPDAAKLLAEGFTGGYEAVKKIDEAFNFLTAAELEQIRLMFESGKAADARTLAFGRFEDKADEAADKSRTQWSDSIRQLSDTWDRLLENLGETQLIQDAINMLQTLADTALRLSGGAPGGSAGAAGGGGLPGGIQRRRDVDYKWGDETVTPGNQYSEQNRQFFNALGTFQWTRPEWMGGEAGANADGDVVITPEIRDIVATVMLEAIDDPQAQRDVAAVILNRMDRSGMTGSQVVRARGQFEPVSARRSEWEAIDEDSQRFGQVLKNILPILEGSVADPTNGATLFVSPGGQAAMGRQMPTWATPENQTLVRGGHEFYRGAFPGDRGQGGVTQQGTEEQRKAGEEELRRMREEIELRDRSNHQLRLEVAEREARARILNAGGTDAAAEEAAILARTAEQEKINEEIKREAEQNARRTEAEQRRQQAAADALRSDLRGLEAQAQRVEGNSLEQRLASIDTRFAGIEQNLAKAAAAGVTSIDGMTFDQYRARVEANKTILKQQEQMKYYEDELAALEQQRSDRLRQIADDAAAGVISMEDAFTQALAVNTELAPQMVQLAQNAEAFATSIRGATPSPALEAFIASMGRVAGREARDTNVAPTGVGNEQLRNGENELNAIISQRNELVANYARLVELGQMTEYEAQQRTAAAYGMTEPLIRSQTEALIELITAMHDSGAMSDAVFQNWITKLEVISQEAEYVDARFVQIKDTLEQGLAQAIMGTFDAAAQSIANALNGTISWGDALNAVWRAALEGVANVLRSIGEMILQMAILQAIKKLPFMDGLTNSIMSGAGLTTGAAALSGAAAATTAAGASLTTAGTVLTASAAPLMAVAEALSAAAIQMQAAASIQIAANASGAGGGGVFHSGGVVGRGASSTTRRLSALAWQGAPKYHGGGIVGLASNEQAAILKVGEEVLTENNPRHIGNMGRGPGGSNGGATPLRQVLVLDPREIAGALQSSAGEAVVMTHIRANATAVRSLIETAG